MKTIKILSVCLLLSVLLTACGAVNNNLDPYKEKFEKISMGDGKELVLSVMGAPNDTSSVELPLVPNVEKLAWNTPVGNRTYRIVFIANKVTGKFVQ
jgi:hypothetical protein